MNKKSLLALCCMVILHSVHLSAYLDEEGIPRRGIFGFRGIINNVKNFITGNWWREAAMLKAFEQNDFVEFEKLFIPEDAGRHPDLVFHALESNNFRMQSIMLNKGLNVAHYSKQLHVPKYAVECNQEELSHIL